MGQAGLRGAAGAEAKKRLPDARARVEKARAALKDALSHDVINKAGGSSGLRNLTLALHGAVAMLAAERFELKRVEETSFEPLPRSMDDFLSGFRADQATVTQTKTYLTLGSTNVELLDDKGRELQLEGRSGGASWGTSVIVTASGKAFAVENRDQALELMGQLERLRSKLGEGTHTFTTHPDLAAMQALKVVSDMLERIANW
jgi:hypothetical protein